MNETRTKHERKFSLDVHERNSWSQFLSFIVHERIRASFVHVRFVHERFLQISFLSFVSGRTNEKPRFFSFMFNVRSSLDERPFVRPGCDFCLGHNRQYRHSAYVLYGTSELNCTSIRFHMSKLL